MPQLSKLLKSRDEWKNKAVERATDNRELRKAQRRHQEKIAELKCEKRYLESAIEEKKHYFPS
jgi:hypothetical protein